MASMQFARAMRSGDPNTLHGVEQERALHGTQAERATVGIATSPVELTQLARETRSLKRRGSGGSRGFWAESGGANLCQTQRI